MSETLRSNLQQKQGILKNPQGSLELLTVDKNGKIYFRRKCYVKRKRTKKS